MRKLARLTLVTIAGGLILAIAAGVVGEFFIEWARERGWYDSPSDRLDAAVNAFSSFVTQAWFIVLAATAIAFAAGAWLDYLLRRRESSVCPPASKGIETLINSPEKSRQAGPDTSRADPGHDVPSDDNANPPQPPEAGSRPPSGEDALAKAESIRRAYFGFNLIENVGSLVDVKGSIDELSVYNNTIRRHGGGVSQDDVGKIFRKMKEVKLALKNDDPRQDALLREITTYYQWLSKCGGDDLIVKPMSQFIFRSHQILKKDARSDEAWREIESIIKHLSEDMRRRGHS